MRLGLILTNDWELYGDGSGDYWEVQHNPMLNFISTIEQYNAKITIMAEVGQQLAYKSIAGSNSEAANICQAWESLIVNAIRSGHDVQLHYHPQWVNAKYDGKWHLNNQDWAIGKLDEDSIRDIIQSGKKYLEDLIHNVSSEYKCKCFRAGAYYIEPSNLVIKVLKENEFVCDTSVTKGMVSDNYFDYTNAFSNVKPYLIDNDVKYSIPNSSIAEFPIYSKISFQSNVLKKILPGIYSKLRNNISIPADEKDWAAKRDKLKSIRYPVSNRFYKQNQKKNLNFYLRQIFSKNALQLDYDYIYPTEFVSILKSILNEKDLQSVADSDIIIPIVASGHIKDVYDSYNIEKILKLIKSEFDSEIIFWTLTEAVDYFFDNQTKFEM